MEKTGFGLSQPHKLSADELAALAGLGSPLISALGAWLARSLSCAHCKRCTRRCEVLEQADLDIGLVEAAFARFSALEGDALNEAVLDSIQEHPELYHALRRCCFCGHCTASCATHMTAAERMREWRQPLASAGLIPTEGSKLVMVDNEWHIFSAYRAIHDISYPEFIALDAASGTGVDTVFFPGCSLASYAPELLRHIGHWLDEAGYRWALSIDCCGSPLMSAGLFERSEALRLRLLEQMRAAGIGRILTVCPGCGEELAAIMGDEMDIVPLPELLLEQPPSHARESASPLSLTFFDSCHDRFNLRHGRAVRQLLRRCHPDAPQREMEHFGKDTLCCGAGGAVATYDAEITKNRVWRIIDEAQATGADRLVTTCPTCSYTIAQALLTAEAEQEASGAKGAAGAKPSLLGRNYLELVFDVSIDWPAVFGRLEAMWTGEYGPWLTQTFFQ
ncbi:MAG: (Fe-S)-binding protein [Coriobacteriales bacterium]|jgi:Fe-S oxidoreductase|nr:(Fe-S)-binding protein [Coriobacteriales bacterium]